MPPPLTRGLLLAILAFVLVARGNAQDLTTEREQFSIAMKALSEGDLVTFRSIETRLRNYPLHPYLRFAALTKGLSKVDPGQVRLFLEQQEASPLGPRLRTRWLRSLANAGRWHDFLEDYKPGLETGLDCRHLEAQYRTGQRDLALKGVPRLWISASSRPDACDPIFRLWIDAGGPSQEQAWKRLQLAAKAGQLQLAKYLKRFLSTADRSTADLWIDGYSNPVRLLEAGAPDPRLTQATPIAVHAMHRLARTEPETAASLLVRVSERYRIPSETIAVLRYKIAVGLAVDGHPGAATWLESVPGPIRDANLRAWSVRTDLRHRNWQGVLEKIESMPPSESSALQWRYWRARAQEALGDSTGAAEAFRSVARERDYHGFLAADRIGAEPSFRNRPLQVDPTLQEGLRKRPPIQRARELYALDRVSEASAEWRLELVDASADEFRAAAKIAQNWGWYYQGIATVARARDWDDLELRFPTRYRDLVLAAARRDGIDPAWIFGVMRQESMFNPTIRSHAGAVGLMQIMPATGRLVAKELGMTWSAARTLVRPEDNISIGSRYLRMGLDKLHGRHIFATAGYNAGPSRVQRWLPAGESIPADVWIELVPFKETRRYLRRVIEYTVIYQHRLDRQTDFVTRAMLPIPGRLKRTAASLPKTAPRNYSFLLEPPPGV